MAGLIKSLNITDAILSGFTVCIDSTQVQLAITLHVFSGCIHIHIPSDIVEVGGVILVQCQQVEVTMILLSLGAIKPAGSPNHIPSTAPSLHCTTSLQLVVRGVLVVELQSLLPAHSPVHHHMCVSA